jgi:hypothetical protein
MVVVLVRVRQAVAKPRPAKVAAFSGEWLVKRMVGSITV